MCERTGQEPPSDQSIHDDMVQCQFQLAEHSAKLRLMYQHYCTTGAVGLNNPCTMDFHQWNTFVAEVMKVEERDKLCDKSMSVAVFMSTTVEREEWSPEMGFGAAIELDQAAPGAKVDVPTAKKDLEKMAASRFVIFDQWKEGLIRLAVACYCSWDDESAEAAVMMKMADALSKLLQEQVLLNGKTIPVDEVFEAGLYSC